MLRLPEGAVLARELTPLPPELVSGRLYRVPSVTAVLGVSLQKPTGRDCETILGDELAKTNASRADPKSQGLVRVDVVEKRMLGALRSLYTEVGARSPEEQQTNMPYRAAATYLVCTRSAAIDLTLTVLRGDLTARARVELDKVATSLTP